MTLTYQYARSAVWLDDLAAERDPHAYDLCKRHGSRLSVPHGWRLDDRRSAQRVRLRSHRLKRSVRGRRGTVDPCPWTHLLDARAPARLRSSAPTFAVSTEPNISLTVAGATWLLGWIGGNILASVIIGASGHANDTSAERPVWLAAATAVSLWIPQIIALVVVCRRFGSGSPIVDSRGAVPPGRRWSGIAIGALSQLVLLRLVYWPLQAIWPDAFSSKNLEENARDLYDRASGGWLVVLVLVVVIGAPIVEEMVYRGLLQGAARRRLNDVVAVVLVAAFFAIIHFRPVEYPGPVRVRARARNLRGPHQPAGDEHRHAHGVQRDRPAAGRALTCEQGS